MITTAILLANIGTITSHVAMLGIGIGLSRWWYRKPH